MLTLVEFTARYTDSKPLSAEYAATLRKRAGALQATCSRGFLPDVMREESVNAFLKSLACSPYTVAKYRQDFLCLWRAAADDDLLPYPIARRIWRPKKPPLVVNCYTVEEVRALVAGAENLKGAMPNGVPRKRYWSAILRLGWATGLRRGDLWKIKPDDVRPDGTLIVAQNKTGRLVTCQVDRQTLDAIRAAGDLRWPLCLRAFAIHFGEISKLAGVNRGVFKWIRRASGSYVEAQQPGAGHKHLGHASAATFNTHYDARLNPVHPPKPPML